MEWIREEWNAVCTAYPRVQLLGEQRRRNLRRRVAQMGGLRKARDTFTAVLAKMAASSFLQGDNKRRWKATFDWLTGFDDNWVKVLEGNYDNPAEDMPQTGENMYNPLTTNKINYGKVNENAALTIGRQQAAAARPRGYHSAAESDAARQAEFARYIVDKLTNPRPPQPDISRYC